MKNQRWRFVPICTLVFALVSLSLFLFRTAPGPNVQPDREAAAELLSGETFTEPIYPIDINTASEEELAFLPGIGPAAASAITAYRQTYGPFSSPTELTRVSGIGEATLRQLLPYITTGG